MATLNNVPVRSSELLLLIFVAAAWFVVSTAFMATVLSPVAAVS